MIPLHLRLAIIAVLLLLAGCSGERTVRRLATPQADSVAREFIVQVRDGKRDDFQGHLVFEIGRDSVKVDSVAALARMFAPGRVRRVELLDARTWWMQGVTTRLLSYQLQSDSGWTFVEVSVRDEGPGFRAIDGIRVAPITGSLRELNAFTLAGKGVLHWLMLALAIATPLFCLTVAVQVMRTPMRGRWIWVLLAMVGVGKVSLNWSTGEWGWMAVNAQLFGAAIQRAGLAGPWFVSVAVPVGAFIALQHVRKVRRAAVDGIRTGEPSPSPAPAAEADVPRGDTEPRP